MFHFPNDVDWSRFFRFDKNLIMNMNWSRLSSAAQAIFPVIACHCNESGVSFPGEEVISALAGLTAKCVRKGISDLKGLPDFNWQYYTTRLGKRGKKFFINFPSKAEKGRVFFFHHGILYGGNWCNLKPSAQALYPAMRYFARYEEDENEDFDEDNPGFNENFVNRKYEICRAGIALMADYAGIEPRSIKAAMDSLQENFLIEPHDDSSGQRLWKVYLIPPKRWKTSYLNRK